MSVAFPQVVEKVQCRFEACGYVRNDPYTAMHNSAQVVLGEIDDSEFATLFGIAPFGALENPQVGRPGEPDVHFAGGRDEGVSH